eukprot:m.267989 g.267989  ORF g.267989 m.267989 type:complete len:57 (-) comp26796_c1_seq4:49-219(-)
MCCVDDCACAFILLGSCDPSPHTVHLHPTEGQGKARGTRAEQAERKQVKLDAASLL